MTNEEDKIDIYQFVKLIAWETSPIANLHRYNIVGSIVSSKHIDGLEISGSLESNNLSITKVIEGYNIEVEELIEAIRFLRKRKAKYQGLDANECIDDLISM
jgi:hypothetical protein